MKEAKMIPFKADCEEPHCIGKALHVVGIGLGCGKGQRYDGNTLEKPED